ncbi:lipopolysaccharide biosynthesis protein [Planktotalea sp.]|uniref:lipopolysaccharide biosynthesis protein n=1 Tax=Planktotalea sp. TaxID=2029877 RepID=UPI003D6AB5A2
MSPLRRIAKNFGMVLSGSLAITAMGFFALALNTRALGIDDLGKLFLVQATCELTAKLISFQNWQSYTKVGADIEGRGSLKALWLYGVALDFAAAAVSALVVVLILLFAPALVGLDPETARLGLFFAAGMLLSGRGTSIGALRLLGAFGWAVTIDVLQAVLLLVNAALLFAIGASLSAYLITIPTITAAASVLVLLGAWIKIKAQDDNKKNPRFDRVARRKFLTFALGVSASGTLNAVRQRGEILIVGAILGPAAAALFGVAYRVSELFSRFAETARVSIFPEFSRLVAAGQFSQAMAIANKISKWATVIAAAAFFGLMVAGTSILALLFGPNFGEAQPMLLLLAAGSAIYASTFAFTSLVQITFGSWRFFAISLFAFGGFCVFGVLGPLFFGLNGAGAGAIANAVVLAALSRQSLMRR